MSYVLALFGLLILIFREFDVFSSDWKMILLGIAVQFFILASALTYHNIYKNETRIALVRDFGWRCYDTSWECEQCVARRYCAWFEEGGEAENDYAKG